jgi:hypothetical protein
MNQQFLKNGAGETYSFKESMKKIILLVFLMVFSQQCIFSETPPQNIKPQKPTLSQKLLFDSWIASNIYVQYEMFADGIVNPALLVSIDALLFYDIKTHKQGGSDAGDLMTIITLVYPLGVTLSAESPTQEQLNRAYIGDMLVGSMLLFLALSPRPHISPPPRNKVLSIIPYYQKNSLGVLFASRF